MKLTKKELNSILVEERRKQRAKNQQSKFMAKTLSIYKGQKRRAEEKGTSLDFSLEQFRSFFEQGLTRPCPYSSARLTLTNVTVDHRVPVARGGSFSLDNQVLCTQSSNYQKGVMTDKEFSDLMAYAGEYLAPEALEDMKRRLTLGGKWAAKSF